MALRILAFSLAAAAAVAVQPVPAPAPVEIVHAPVACVVADRYPRLEATFTPLDRVGMARIYFQGATSDWYSVSMKKEGDRFVGVLPKPKKELKSLRYYIEVIGQGAQSTRTSERTAGVVRSASECKGLVGAALASASVIVQGPAGVASLPAGFASSGVIAGNASGAASGTATAGSGAAAAGAAAVGAAGAAGGIGATALVVGGLAAGGAVAVGVAAKGGDDGGSDSSSNPNSNSPSNLILLSVTIVTASGSSGSISTPNIDVSACRANTTFGGGPITVRADGSFDETWNLNSPALRVAGRADANGLTATLTCISGGGPTGSMSASGSNYSLSGSFNFGSSQFGSQGTISVRRTQ